MQFIEYKSPPNDSSHCETLVYLWFRQGLLDSVEGLAVVGIPT